MAGGILHPKTALRIADFSENLQEHLQVRLGILSRNWHALNINFHDEILLQLQSSVNVGLFVMKTSQVTERTSLQLMHFSQQKCNLLGAAGGHVL